jgi:hypothetical protein
MDRAHPSTAFVQEVVKPEGEDGVYVVCNSVGGVAGLQLCLDRPDLVKGIMLLNISLRMLHIKKQPVLLRPFVAALQTALRETFLGALFFGQVATPKGVRNVLEQVCCGCGWVYVCMFACEPMSVSFCVLCEAPGTIHQPAKPTTPRPTTRRRR